jgi:hypothetical protein
MRIILFVERTTNYIRFSNLRWDRGRGRIEGSIRFTYIRSKDGRSKDKRPKDKRSNDKRSKDNRSKDKRSKSTEHRMTEHRIGPNVENDQNFYTKKFL